MEEAAQRGQFGEERYEKIDFQIKVRQQFMNLKAEDESQLATSTTNSGTSNCIPWHVLDARKSIDILKEEIRQIAEDTIKRVTHLPVQKMWIEQ